MVKDGGALARATSIESKGDNGFRSLQMRLVAFLVNATLRQ